MKYDKPLRLVLVLAGLETASGQYPNCYTIYTSECSSGSCFTCQVIVNSTACYHENGDVSYGSSTNCCIAQ